MIISFELNGRTTEAEIAADACLMDTLRSLGCASVKCGCDTTNCGMCTVIVEDRPVLSCAYLSARVNGKKVTTLEGMQEEAEIFAGYMAAEGADQCGFCNPGFVVNVIALKRSLREKEGKDISTEEIREFLAGNICRCTGYASQERAITEYLRETVSKD